MILVNHFSCSKMFFGYYEGFHLVAGVKSIN